jgi:DNA-binding CsgD family transcriptional regulator
MAGVISLTLNKPEKKRSADDLPNGSQSGDLRKSLTDSSLNDFTHSIVGRRLGPGILILTSSTQLLYKDRRAWELCAEISNRTDSPRTDSPHTDSPANTVIPTQVTELCEEVAKLLHIWTDAKDWEQIRIKRVIGNPDRPILLCGLGIPDRHGLQQSRILITMEEIGRRRGAVIEQVKDIFHLTEREVTVVQNLLKGWTNKEIAHELGVTEQTVKEHIKHIMAKTKTTTRTGILVQVLRL